MKIVITGHGAGIGKCLYEKATSLGHTVVGFTYKDGNDINLPEIQAKIVEECKDAEIFINNAFSVKQTQLLKLVHESWIGQEKLIINISSAVTYLRTPETLPDSEIARNYFRMKSEQDEYAKHANLHYDIPYVMNVRPGSVDTPLSRLYQKVPKELKMQPEEVAEIIMYHAEKFKTYQVLDIVFGVTKASVGHYAVQNNGI